MGKIGSIYLIPTYLSSDNNADFLTVSVLNVIKGTRFFLVENIRTARRFISSLNLNIDISQLTFQVLDKSSTPSQLEPLIAPLFKGENIGVISEAGLPGLADPGAIAVAFGHRKKIRVEPLPGASSIQTALIVSGFSGQQFTFHGYLPIPKTERIDAIRDLETQLHRTGYTQLFMETPYRNDQLFQDLLKHLKPTTYLSIAADLFGNEQFIQTQSVRDWKKDSVKLHKLPAIFSLGQMH